MIDENAEIAEKIRNGSYYTDARDWYMRRYLYPISERSFLIIVAIILLTALLLSSTNTSSISVENNERPFIVPVEDSMDHFSLIKPLAKSSESAQEAIAKYFIIDYLRTREEYIPAEMHGKKLQYKIKKIKSSSSKQVQTEYQNYMNYQNPYSPTTRYKDHTSRSIDIRSVHFDKDDPKSGKVRVIFKATTKKRPDGVNNTKEEKNDSMWEATIHFRLPDIETIAKTQAPLRFLVKYYRAKLIEHK